jgi:hypothetical protein
MSVIKSKAIDQKNDQTSTFTKSPMNQWLDEFRSKMKEQTTKYISGSSDSHVIPANSGGLIEIPIECDYEYIPHISLQCSDSLNGINICIIKNNDKNKIIVSIENLLDIKREIRINYFLH